MLTKIYRWLKEHRSALANWTVCLLALAVITVVITSLTMGLVLRMRVGANWEQLGPIGDYWGGHLSGVALAILAISLLIQQQELKLQTKGMEDTQKSVEREISSMEENISQARAHFMLEQLRDLGHSLEFVVVRYASTEIEGFGRERHSGVARLSLFIKHYFEDPDDIEAIVCDFTALRDFIAMGVALREVLRTMPEATRTWSSILLDTIFPRTIENFYQDLIQNQSNHKAQIEPLCIETELKNYLYELIDEGWEILYQKSGTNFAAALVRDLVFEKESYSTDGTHCASVEEALTQVVNKKRTAGSQREHNL